jgi:hypothetical protein
MKSPIDVSRIHERQLTDEEITRRMNDAVHVALCTPAKSLKDFVGVSERAMIRREGKIRKEGQLKTK